VNEKLFIALQKIAPKQLLTEFAGWAAQGGVSSGLTQSWIRWFIQKYAVNMSEAAQTDYSTYATFNEFFTRALKPESRPVANGEFSTWVCPVDGAISQFGRIQNGQIFQAKGHEYSSLALLGGSAGLASEFAGGEFACIYLSPKDYHRIHMPVSGQLRQMIYVPGKLYSVNPTTARHIPQLFAVNERVICVFDTDFGPFVNVLVGATIVGSMVTSWHGVVNPPRRSEVTTWDYAAGQHYLSKGAEMGQFRLGSTVVMLWPKHTLSFNPNWAPGNSVRLFEAMGRVSK
jgi:phosphatidylserine decarboxylase